MSVGRGGKKRIEVKRPAVPLKPEQCRGFLRRTVAAAFPDVVEGFLNEAAKGGCAHLKMAAETVASKPRVYKPRVVKGAAELLMEELEREGL